jgi:signal transduction histidine kinase
LAACRACRTPSRPFQGASRLGDEIEIKLTLAEGLSRIVCNRQRLESAVLNLAISARDAMPFGGTLAITTFHAEPA